MTEQPTPVDADQNARLSELLHRARQDFDMAQARRQATSREDRVHGNETGGR